MYLSYYMYSAYFYIFQFPIKCMKIRNVPDTRIFPSFKLISTIISSNLANIIRKQNRNSIFKNTKKSSSSFTNILQYISLKMT